MSNIAHDLLNEYRDAARQLSAAAKAFEAACRSGDVEQFREAWCRIEFSFDWQSLLNRESDLNGDGAKQFALAAARTNHRFYVLNRWRLPFLRLRHLHPDRVDARIRRSFLDIWISHKTMSRSIDDRRLVADALRRILPRSAGRKPQLVYRGAFWSECRGPRYGFSWTTKLGVARQFAHRYFHKPGERAIFMTTAPADAIFSRCEDQGAPEEGEVIIDPFRLTRVRVIERWKEPSAELWSSK